MSFRRLKSASALTILMLGLTTYSTGLSAAEGDRDVSNGVVFRPITRVHPVLGADDKIHLVYELEIVNHSSMLVSVDDVEALGPGGESLAQFHGDALAGRILVSGGSKGKSFAPSHSGYINLDIVAPASSVLPAAIRHRIAMTTERPADAAAEQPTRPDGQSTTFLGAEVVVDSTPAVVISAPLRGSDWLVGNGCCDVFYPHRTALAINGTLNVPEKFAIDFLQLDRDHRLFSGPIDKLSSYAYYGAPVYSVADGTVVEVEDGAPDETPGALPLGMTPARAAGNHVILDLGNGRYALYAHFQTGSLRVKVGDRVHRGDILAKLGNSGNTTSPHLHFQVGDRPSFLTSEALPFVIDDFASTGAVTELDVLLEGKPGTLDKTAAGRHLRQLPLEYSVVTFY